MNLFESLEAGDSPIRIAPATSQKVANQQACRIVKTPDPTLVPNEFATSLKVWKIFIEKLPLWLLRAYFAPIPNAKMKAIMKPIITSQSTPSEYGSMMTR